MAAPSASRRKQHEASSAAVHSGKADPDALKQHIYGQLKRSGVVASLKVSRQGQRSCVAAVINDSIHLSVCIAAVVLVLRACLSCSCHLSSCIACHNLEIPSV
jgi:hypothetical protein